MGPRWHEPVEIIFSISVLVFGLTLILIFTRLVEHERGFRTLYMQLVVLTIVVTTGLFVIVAGYTQDQISPMIGLLGTLVGYLLGREKTAQRPKPLNAPLTPNPDDAAPPSQRHAEIATLQP